MGDQEEELSAEMLAFLESVDPSPTKTVNSMRIAQELPDDQDEISAEVLAFLDSTDPITPNLHAPGSTFIEAYVSSENTPSLAQSLERYFGFSDFRPGQYDAVLSALQGRDVAVFWATGSGKSVCYLLPALVSNNVTIVVSPLISLMQDQCAAFNNTVGKGRELAVFLGSSQSDRSKETAAFDGKYLGKVHDNSIIRLQLYMFIFN